ncbi:hypothetical protein PoB_006341700 [Plakobranchus ocellatus]|uniref:Uncharacterized protein n=1 Tax=Plakobranchus ocellatus TaxID=259542 RepID=A0AAV4CYC2_9GAST|nr:hypothetical protein PoB_006341700 [Plakobranchus ocellatus]
MKCYVTKQTANIEPVIYALPDITKQRSHIRYGPAVLLSYCPAVRIREATVTGDLTHGSAGPQAADSGIVHRHTETYLLKDKMTSLE